MTIQQAISLALQNQRLESSKPRSISAPPAAIPFYPHTGDSIQTSQHQAAAAHSLGSRSLAGGMAALMIKEQQSREGGILFQQSCVANCHEEYARLFHRCAGDLKLVDGASKGGIEELKASADAIAKIAKKISALRLGDKQVVCCVLLGSHFITLMMDGDISSHP
jgi:hypothetical protein